jgi:hypothetical protein
VSNDIDLTPNTGIYGIPIIYYLRLFDCPECSSPSRKLEQGETYIEYRRTGQKYPSKTTMFSSYFSSLILAIPFFSPSPNGGFAPQAIHPNGNSRKCLDVRGAVFADGTPVQMSVGLRLP